MNLRDLSNGEMISVSTPLVDPGSDARKAIESNPLTAAVAFKLDRAHEGLLTLLRPVPTDRITALAKKLVALDQRHDNIARGFNSYLAGLITLSCSPERAQELASLKAFVVGDDLSFINRTYLAEAGRLRNLNSTLSQQHKAILKSLKADSRTLYDWFVEWCEIGEEMRATDLERAAIEAALPKLPSRADSVSARCAWISAMNAMVAMAELAEMPGEIRAAFLGQLDSLLARTAGRGKKAKPAPQETPTPPQVL